MSFPYCKNKLLVIAAGVVLFSSIPVFAESYDYSEWKATDGITPFGRVIGDENVVISKINDKWALSDANATCSYANSNCEVIAILWNKKQIALGAQRPKNVADLNQRYFNCPSAPLLGSSDQGKNKQPYNFCTSSLIKLNKSPVSLLGAGFGAFNSAMNLGTKGNEILEKAVDTDELLKAFTEADVLRKLDERKVAAASDAYHRAFAAATTSSSIKLFIEKYKDSDPDNLVQQAQSRLLEAELIEYRNAFDSASNLQTIASLNGFIARYSSNDPEQLIPKANELIQGLEKKAAEEEAARAKADAASAKAVAIEEAARAKADILRYRERVARQDKERKQLESFRKTLAEGIETNCGPVIEAKQKLIKVAVAVSNYGTEHWIKRNEIFPAGYGYGCRFVNGQYQSPE